jgi:predicted ATPase/DNA-binding SARP family transcriptional activator
VRVTLLGAFTIRAGERVAGPWSRPSTRRLCELLMVSVGRKVNREVARELLFPDLSPDSSANALRKALSTARNALSSLGEGSAVLLQSDRDHIWVPSEAVEVDLLDHEKALQSALRMSPGHPRDAALCAALSEDRVLLEEEPYADWAIRPREALELLRQRARLALARDRLKRAGRSTPELVVDAWEAVLAHEPASEEAAGALMQLYAAQGQRHLVVRTYQRCSAGLEELGLNCSPALEEVHSGATLEATLRSLDKSDLKSNLPGYPSTFIGRAPELGEVRLLVESSPLVTLSGAGGSGKTRLAVEVASQLLDGSNGGVFFVDLAPISEPHQVATAFAAALGVHEHAGRSLAELLIEVLSGQDLVIVVDNCEHVVDACAKLADQVNRSCPSVHLLATSREPLGIDGEHVYRVPSLSLPSESASSPQEIESSDAAKLFLERARAHDAAFALDEEIAALVASICRRLDGMPFAIELAAARLASMSLFHLNERLDQSFRLLTMGARTAAPRQRTLQATVDWSFDLLSPPEQGALVRLAVFSGGFELEAAEAVCASDTVASFEVADLLASLVNKSLIVAERSRGLLRYRLLETIRQYAAEKLAAASGMTSQARLAHAQYYLDLGEAIAPELTGPRQGQWLKRLDLEWDNIRAAFANLFAEPHRTDDVLRLGSALHRFIGSRGHFEAIAMLRAALERPGPVPTKLHARALSSTGHVVSYSLGIDSAQEMSAAGELCQRGLELARTIDEPGLVAEALYMCAFAAHMQGQSRQAARLGQEALQVARSVGDPRLIGLAFTCLARAAITPARKRALWREALTATRRAGDFYYSIPELWGLADLELDLGQFGAARGLYEEAIAAGEEVGSPMDLWDSWGSLGWVLLLQGEFEGALQLCRKSLMVCRRVGRRGGAASAIFRIACCATGMGNYLLAAELTGAKDAIDADVNGVAPEMAYNPGGLEQRVRDGNWKRLRQVLGEAELERAHALGLRLSFDEATDVALGKVVLGATGEPGERNAQPENL